MILLAFALWFWVNVKAISCWRLRPALWILWGQILFAILSPVNWLLLTAMGCAHCIHFNQSHRASVSLNISILHALTRFWKAAVSIMPARRLVPSWPKSPVSRPTSSSRFQTPVFRPPLVLQRRQVCRLSLASSGTIISAELLSNQRKRGVLTPSSSSIMPTLRPFAANGWCWWMTQSSVARPHAKLSI